MSLPLTIKPTTKAVKATKSSTSHTASMKCSYRSKPCNSVRATKLNGDFHKLCEYHRRRANLNQQRVHQRRKLREYASDSNSKTLKKDIELSTGSSSPSSVSASYDATSWSWMTFASMEQHFNYNTGDFELEVEPSHKPCGDLPLPDLELLELLLSDNACSLQMSAEHRFDLFD